MWTTIVVAVFVAFVAVIVVVPKFVHAKDPRQMNHCVNNLRQMDGATQQWAIENEKKLGDKITMSDITPYLKNDIYCPQGGKYTIGPAVSNAPTCSFRGHVLPQ